MNLNKVFLLGNVTRDVEIKVLPKGDKLASFSLATNRFYTDNTGEKKQETEFHNIVVFGKLADICERYIKKGSQVMVEGRIKTRNWETDGIKKYKTEVIAENIQFNNVEKNDQVIS
jgi:single-strand DNA-binding protein